MRATDAEVQAVEHWLETSTLSLTILDTLPVALFLVDRDGRVLWTNSEARRWLGPPAPGSEPQRGGRVLRCREALKHTDCGEGPECDRCVLRRSVGQAFDGRQITRRRTVLQRHTPRGVEDTHMLVTALPLAQRPDVVLLALQDVSELMQLRGLIPICSHCKKIREDNKYWRSVEQYLGERLDARFSHGICPDCIREFYADDLGLTA